jgi:hypothetical protein
MQFADPMSTASVTVGTKLRWRSRRLTMLRVQKRVAFGSFAKTDGTAIRRGGESS